MSYDMIGGYSAGYRRHGGFGADVDMKSLLVGSLALMQRLGPTGKATLADAQAFNPNATQADVDTVNTMSPTDRQAQIVSLKTMLGPGPGVSTSVGYGDDAVDPIDQFRGFAFRYTLQSDGTYLVERIPGSVGPPAFMHPEPASATVSLKQLTALMMGGFGPNGPTGTSMGTAKPTAAALARDAAGLNRPLFGPGSAREMRARQKPTSSWGSIVGGAAGTIGTWVYLGAFSFWPIFLIGGLGSAIGNKLTKGK